MADGGLHCLEVFQADAEAFEGVAVAGVLFDDVPFDVGGSGGLEDGGPVEVSFTDFHHVLLAGEADAHVFEVEAGDAVGDFSDPVGGVGSAVGDPVGVDFEEDGGIEAVEEDLQGGLTVEAGEFVAVVVVTDADAGGGVGGGGVVEVVGEAVPVGGGGILGEKTTDGGVLAVPEMEFIDQVGGIFDLIEGGVCGAAGEALVFQHAGDVGGGDGTDGRDLHGGVAEGANALHGFGEVGEVFGEVAKGVELGCNLNRKLTVH